MFGLPRTRIRFNFLVGVVFAAVVLAWFLLFRLGFVPGTSNRAAAESRPARLADTVVVMSYNVENLFDMVDNGGEYPEFKPNQCNWNDYTFGVRVHNLAAVIASANPAIAVLYEVENQNALEALRVALEQKGKLFKYSAIADRPNATGTCPAMLSTYPIIFAAGIPTIAVEGHFTRNILEAHVLLGQDSLVVFGNHWPSRKYAESYRISVASILADHIKKLAPGTDYLIAGDLNEDYNECEVFYSEHMDDSHGVTALNHVLGTVSTPPYAPIRFRAPGEVSAESLAHFDPWVALPQEQRRSHSFQGQWATLDHFLLPPSLFDSSGVSYVPGSFSVFTMHDTLLKDSVPFGWQVAYGGPCPVHKGLGYSDHLPILARFCCRPFTGGAAIPELGGAQRDDKNGVSGFESGYEGWVGEAPGIHLLCDTAQVRSGSFSLRIAGVVRNENATVARYVIPAAIIAARRIKGISWYVKGSGRLCLRARGMGDRQWIYFVGSELKQAKAAKYSDLSAPQWTRISVPMSGIATFDRGLELEVRAAKKSTIQIWIDDVAAAYESR